jgi:translation initiation factor 1 (eIF-1/SUI1)
MSKSINPFAALQNIRDELPNQPEDNLVKTIPKNSAPTMWKHRGKITLSMTRVGRGGKTVTHIHGLVIVPEQESEHLALIKKKLGVGAQWEHNAQGVHILVVQGDQRTRIKSWFESMKIGPVQIG